MILSRLFPEIDHSGNDARIVYSKLNSAKKLPLMAYTHCTGLGPGLGPGQGTGWVQ